MNRYGGFWRDLHKLNVRSAKWYIFLAVYHYALSLFAYYYSLARPSDAHNYWFIGKDIDKYAWPEFFFPGTKLILALTYPFVKYADLGISSGFLIFSTIGLAGILLFDYLSRKTVSEKFHVVVSVMALMPSLHFWTGLIGKEPVCFTLTVLCIACFFHRKYLHFMVYSAFLALFRPHYAFIILISAAFAALFDRTFTSKIKWTIASVVSCFSLFFFFILTQIANLKPDPFSAVMRIYKRHIEFFKDSAGYVPIDTYPLPYKLFTFYFRPLPFENMRWEYLAASVENAVLLIIFLAGSVHFIRKKGWNLLSVNERFMLIYFLVFGIVFVFGYANFGIILRTKIMALPFIYILLFSKRNNEIKDYPHIHRPHIT